MFLDYSYKYIIDILEQKKSMWLTIFKKKAQKTENKLYI